MKMTFGDSYPMRRLTVVFLWRCSILVLLLNSINPQLGSAYAKSKKPHLIVMVADDFGWNDIGFHNPDIKSPHLDDLAHSGIILNHSYVQHVCTPSRAALMTGFFPLRTGMQRDVIPLFGPCGLPTQFKLLPEALKDLGYSTHLVGKWHLGNCNKDYLPTNRGFDSFLGLLSGGQFYYVHGYNITRDGVNEGSGNVTFTYDFWNQSDPAWNYYGVYSSIPFVLRVEHILKSWDGHSPLFLYLPFQLTHAPQQVPYENELWYPEIGNKYRKTFSAMVSELDSDVGKIVNLLRYYGVYDDSVILFTADNGGETRNGGNNYPLRGNKYTYWEGGTRAAGFIHSPLLKSTGYTYNGLIHVVDWFPTLVSLAGGETDTQMDGKNVWDAVANNSPSPRKHFVYNLEYRNGILNGAIRVGDWKLILDKAGTPADKIKPEDVTGEYADAIGHPSDPSDVEGYPPFRLFNLTDDPGEDNNVANDNLDVIEELLSVVTYYRNKMVEPVFQPDDIDMYHARTTNLTYLNTDWCEAIESVTLLPKMTVKDLVDVVLGTNKTVSHSGTEIR